ncbi:FkbM family methyltransferase [Gillisia sp. Hel_I_29]|uniref:FkbM family methyltransferase n=1 Tax=Gillisia sp. Hel_I_29 TaxID=1249975 RepID=UPI0018CE198D|nr:FkbM family methyltransferase [Gillisia sp. Hel_I_29]
MNKKKGNSQKNIEYSIGKYTVNIPHNHPLPQYQKSNKLYDRFLPVLVKNLNSDKIIIDVGANVGDSTIALIQNCENPIYSIEPSELFYPYLEKNIKKLLYSDKKRVICLNKFIGTGDFNGQLLHSGGSASVTTESCSNVINYETLDGLIQDHSAVELIKVDTDGYDFDVLKSSGNILIKSEPILFWENQMFEEFQIKGFNDLYKILEKIGYKYIYIFDNFGNLIIEESDFITLKKINSYVLSMDRNQSTRTFFYTDILAATERNHSTVKKAMLEYKKDWLPLENTKEQTK